ncbi:hypothetical protein [Methanococcoides vulcani]|nr:hypothetical protein [Methanococcoides vulcani]
MDIGEDFDEWEINHHVWEIGDAIERLQELMLSIQSLKVEEKDGSYSYSYAQMVPGDESSFEEIEEESTLPMSEFFREKMAEILLGCYNIKELEEVYKEEKIVELKRDFYRQGIKCQWLHDQIARGEVVDQSPEDIMDNDSYRCYRT